MAIILTRLQQALHQNPSTSEVSIDRYINDKESVSDASKTALFTLLVHEDTSLIQEYQLLRLLLEQTMKAWKAETNPEQQTHLEATVVRLVKEALQLSTLLDEKYSHYINDRPNCRKKMLETHRERYHRWLLLHEHPLCLHERRQPEQDMLFADEIRKIFEQTNPYRLGALRTRRLLRALIPILNQCQQYAIWVLWLDGFAAPAFLYINVLFFLPRLILNVYTLGTHWMEHAAMSPEERSLGFNARFAAQWDRLWPNLTNDVGWAINAVLMLLVVTGSWQVYSLYVSLVSQTYDLLLNGLRGYQELQRLQGLEQHYQGQRQSAPPETQVELDDYLTLLQQRILSEQRLVWLSLTNFSVLFIVAVLALPSLASLNPWIPVLSAAASVVITVVNFGTRGYLAPTNAKTLDTLLDNPVNPAETVEPERVLETNRPEPVATLKRRHSSAQLLSSHPSILFSQPMKTSHSQLALNRAYSPTGVPYSLSNGQFLTREQSKPTLHHSPSENDYFLFNESNESNESNEPNASLDTSTTTKHKDPHAHTHTAII